MNSSLKTILTALVAGAVGGVAVFGFFWHSYDSKLRQSFFGLSSDQASSTSTLSVAELHDALVVNTIKKENPAVVSITLSETASQIAAQNNNGGNSQFDQFFNDFFGAPAPQTPSVPRSDPENASKLQEIAAGSGFFISSDGYIVTNKHVVDTAEAVYTVYTNDGKKHAAKVVAKDPILDIALVKIDGTGYPILSLGDSDAIEVGQTAIAIGNALGEFRNTVSVGVISGLSRSIVAGDGAGVGESLDQVIQTDAAINPGNSGGPLLDLEGKVIGINVAVAESSQSIGFALPVNDVKGILESVRKTGKIIRPYIGIRYTPIDDAVKDEFKLTVDSGDLVKGAGKSSPAIIPNSPAAKAGIKENDIVEKANKVTIDLDHDLASMVRAMNVGDKVTLVVLRDGKNMNIVVTLEAAPDSTS